MAAISQCRGKNARQIVAVIGDGSALYASEALWTAGHHNTKILLVILANRRYATLNAAASKLAGGPLKSFTIEPPVIDFSGLATLYDWRYHAAATGAQLDAALAQLGGTLAQNTLLELKLDPALLPVTASRHF
jgi:benzoylformate decarboxylase